VNQTAEGKTRQRQPGGGTKGTLRTFEDKLLFILVYQKTYPLQTMHGLQFELSQPQTYYWIHRLLPMLQRALAEPSEKLLPFLTKNDAKSSGDRTCDQC
jgi:hypothetical protein